MKLFVPDIVGICEKPKVDRFIDTQEDYCYDRIEVERSFWHVYGMIATAGCS